VGRIVVAGASTSATFALIAAMGLSARADQTATGEQAAGAEGIVVDPTLANATTGSDGGAASWLERAAGATPDVEPPPSSTATTAPATTAPPTTIVVVRRHVVDGTGAVPSGAPSGGGSPSTGTSGGRSSGSASSSSASASPAAPAPATQVRPATPPPTQPAPRTTTTARSSSTG
jgi:hypothetical protein